MPPRHGDWRSHGHLDVLGSIPEEYRASVLEQCARRSLRKGQMIWSQGEPAEYVAFLMSGTAMSQYQDRNGKTGTTGFWRAGDILGAGDLGSRTTRLMTVRCIEPCVLYTLSYPRFQQLAHRFPELADAVIRALSLRLRWVAQLAVMLETQSGFERICGVLLALADHFARPAPQGIVIDLRLTNEDLAAISGVSRQFANSTLGDLRRRGLLHLRRRSLVISDYKTLAGLVGSDAGHA